MGEQTLKLEPVTMDPSHTDFGVAGTSTTEAAPRPIRVGIVVHAMQVAGVEMLIMEMIERLAGLIDPTIFCLDAVGPLGEQLRAAGVEVVCLERRPGHDLRVAWRLAHALRTREIEIVHAHQYTPFFYSALARFLPGCRAPLIFTEHGRHYPDLVSPLRRAVNRWLLDRQAAAVNAVCAFSARSLSAVDGFAAARIEVIENGIDVDRYGPAVDREALRMRLALDPTRRYLINVARFHPIKDHATLLRGFASVARSKPDVDLLLVGDGPLRGALEDLAQALGVRPRVHFLGVRSDVPDLLPAADLFALTSVCEAASLTLLEAMATGLPIVVTAVGGNPEIVRDGIDCLHVPRGDVPRLTEAILRLLDTPDLARSLGTSGSQRVRTQFRLRRTIDDYYNLYRRLCRGGSESTKPANDVSPRPGEPILENKAKLGRLPLL